MCDIFTKYDARDRLKGKSILYLGDSIMRNMYKDLIHLISPDTNNVLTPRKDMCAKGEKTYLGDILYHGSELTRERRYEEKRDFYFKEYDLQVSFFFITRCYSHEFENLMKYEYTKQFGSYPDCIIMNSLLWDLNRWGPTGYEHYKKNLRSLFSLFQGILPEHTQVIWMTTPPISTDISGGFMIEELEFQRHSMRFLVMEGNHYAAHLCAAFSFDVLDMHYHFTPQVHRRSTDGVHWNPDAVRMMTNIFLTHFCVSRKLQLPGNVPSSAQGGTNALERVKMLAEKAEEEGKKAPKEEGSHLPGRRIVKAARRH